MDLVCEEDPGTEDLGGDGGAVDTVADVSDSGVESGGGVLSDWNGEIDAIGGQDWYSGLEEGVRGRVSAGLKAKHDSWNKGYNAKFQALATERTTFEEGMGRREAKAASDLELAKKFWYGDSDADPRVAELTAERDALMAERDGLRTSSNDLKASAYEAKVKAQWPGIYANDDALNKFADLVIGGLSEDDAAGYVRHSFSLGGGDAVAPADLPVFAPTRQPSRVLEAGGDGSGGSLTRPNELDGMSVDDAFRRARFKAQQEDEANGLM